MTVDEELRPIGASRSVPAVGGRASAPVQHIGSEEALDPLRSALPEEVRAARDLVARLRGAWPAVAEAVVEAAVGAAYASFREATVRAYVPILVERRASKALHETAGDPTTRGGAR
ncbi:three-helix bundle dimerization domain-containing protein [Streptomyces scabiei]|uniref:three-helix bundle dimerization domain-containing protein n=1 Tax=Streptomyces scabiei TaxID=1930 RepID=UPI0029AD85C3|nr:hypothetical protein [Streptomyces scabiei]MDX3117747.1 hypothetical protein [Streptomyces scabiei]